MAAVLTNNGRAFITFKLGATGVAQTFNPSPNAIGWGTGPGVSSNADTGLFVESNSASGGRVTATLSSATTSSANDTLIITGTMQADLAKTITNAGVFERLTGGYLLAKMDFSGVPLLAGDQVVLTFKLQVA